MTDTAGRRHPKISVLGGGDGGDVEARVCLEEHPLGDAFRVVDARPLGHLIFQVDHLVAGLLADGDHQLLGLSQERGPSFLKDVAMEGRRLDGAAHHVRRVPARDRARVSKLLRRHADESRAAKRITENSVRGGVGEAAGVGRLRALRVRHWHLPFLPHRQHHLHQSLAEDVHHGRRLPDRRDERTAWLEHSVHLPADLRHVGREHEHVGADHRVEGVVGPRGEVLRIGGVELDPVIESKRLRSRRAKRLVRGCVIGRHDADAR
mmetsp:Transcript_2575/g.6020  ORF Transcript_2575/g.6020 Transcript_2575/m.6020 type:complete len:264 (-) Transcript_2575:341-1132(-)